MNILSEAPITMAQLKDDLKKIYKRDEELNFRATKTDEYLKNFVHLNLTKAKELQKALEGLNVPRLKEEHIVKLIDLLPGSIEELKTIFSGYTVTVSADNQKKIVETIKPYVSTKKEISVPAPKEPEPVEKAEEPEAEEKKEEKEEKAEAADEKPPEPSDAEKVEEASPEADSSPEEKPEQEDT